jgi:hypothetical protein
MIDFFNNIDTKDESPNFYKDYPNLFLEYFQVISRNKIFYQRLVIIIIIPY